MLVAYDYVINAIMVELMKDATKTSIIEAHGKTSNNLKEKYYPQITVMDNFALKDVIKYL